MANVFAITTVTDKLKAEKGSATTVFTVTNTTSHALRGIGKIKPIGNTEAAWLKVEGETEREFSANGTHQFTVSFNKPESEKTPAAAQPAESFPFRFDAISSVNPDEDFTEGPIVTVEIPERKAVEKKPFPWLIVGIIAALLLIVGGVVLFLVLRDSGVEVPDVTTKKFEDAEKILKEKGFTAEKVEEIAPDKELGSVFKQEPGGGKNVSSDKKTVKLSIPATSIVPPLKTLLVKDATNTLQKLGLTINIEGNEIVNGKPNQVDTQNPAENTTVAKGTAVNVKLCTNTIEIAGRGRFCIKPRIPIGNPIVIPNNTPIAVPNNIPGRIPVIVP